MRDLGNSWSDIAKVSDRQWSPREAAIDASAGIPFEDGRKCQEALVQGKWLDTTSVYCLTKAPPTGHALRRVRRR
jgi:hypothetical protein